MDAYNFSLLSARKKAWKICGTIETLLASLTGLQTLTPERFIHQAEKLRRYLAGFPLPETAPRLPVPESGLAKEELIRILRKISYAVLDQAGVPAPETDFSSLRSAQQKRFPARPTEHEVLLDDVRSPFNIGSVIRTAEAFGFNRVILCGLAARANQVKVLRAAMSAEEWITVVRLEGIGEALSYLSERRGEGFRITAIEKTPESLPLEGMTPAGKRILLIGNEEFGISPELLAAADEIRHITLAGVKNSLNLAVAFGMGAKSVVESCLKAP